MIEKLTLEQFQQLRSQLDQIIKFAEAHSEDENLEELEQSITEQYLEIQNRLLSYDLSDIPFEAWQDFVIFSDETHVVDFSRTKANIDFGLVQYDFGGNFSGCNVRNLDKIVSLNPNDFDEQTIQMNSSLFLTDNFDSEFKDKYYSRTLTFGDLTSLSSKQLEEISQKKIREHMVDYNNNIADGLGLDKAVQLYNYSQYEFEAVKQVFSVWYPKCYSIFSTAGASEIKNTDVTEIKKFCFNFIRQHIIGNPGLHFSQKDFPELFIKENADIFLVNANIPDEVKERYFNRHLKLDDLLNYFEAFQSVPVDYFMVDDKILEFFRDNYGIGKYQELVQKHPDLFLHIQQENDFNQFSSFLVESKDLDLETTFSNAVRKYFLKSIQTNDINRGYVPNWMSSMNFKIVWEVNNINNLLQYIDDKNSIIVSDDHKVNCTVNLVNIIKKNGIEGSGIMSLYGEYIEYAFKYGIQFFEYNSNFSKDELLDELDKAIFYDIISRRVKFGENMPEHFKNSYPELLDGKYIEYVLKHSIQFFEYNSNFSKDELLDELDKKIFYCIIRGGKYDENMPEHFKNRYPELFLGTDVPEDIRKKFYGRAFDLSEFSNPNLLKYFSDTDIAVSLRTGVQQYQHYYRVIGLLKGEAFLDFVEKSGQLMYEEGFFEYLRKREIKNLTFEEIGPHLFEYFNSEGRPLNIFHLFDEIGYQNDFIIQMKKKLEKLQEVDLRYSQKLLFLLEDNVVNRIGYDVVEGLLHYNTNASGILIKALKNGDDFIIQWIEYIKKLPNYDSKLLHLALLNYNVANSRELIENLVNNKNIQLNDEQFQNLCEILRQRNKYGIVDINSLSNINYMKHRLSFLKDKFESVSDLYLMKDSILEILFSVSFNAAEDMFNSYGLKSQEVMKRMFDKGIISTEDEAIISIVKEILEEDNVDELRRKFETITKLNEIVTLSSLNLKLKKFFGQELKSSLFQFDSKDQEGISYSSTNGIDVDGMLDINGRPMSHSDSIKVINLEGIDFKLLIHCTDGVSRSYSIAKNPSHWNKSVGTNELSTSMISDQHMACMGGSSAHSIVFYGFNDISDNSLVSMHSADANTTSLDERLFFRDMPIGNFISPDVLQTICSGQYNEIVLDRRSSKSSNYGHRLQPNCIICFDGMINDASRKAAQYFNIPICMIHRMKYIERNQSIMEKYEKGEINSFSLSDVKRILFSNMSFYVEESIFGRVDHIIFKNNSIECRYTLFLNLIDKALSESMINLDEYIALLEEARNLISYNYAFSSYYLGNVDFNEITERINRANVAKSSQRYEEVPINEGRKR